MLRAGSLDKPYRSTAVIRSRCRQGSTMKYETIILERKEGIGYLTLNRPDRANTISFQLMQEVVGAMAEVEADSEYRVVIVTGAGKHFCGGADLRDFAERARERASSGAERQGSRDFVRPQRDLF